MEFPALPCPWLLCFSRFPCPGPTVLRLFDPAQDQKVLECRALLHLTPPPTMRAWWSCLGLFCCLSPNSTLPWLYGYVLLLHRTCPDPSFSIGSLVTSQQGPSILHLSLLGVGSGWINFSRAAFFANEKKEDQKRVFFWCDTSRVSNILSSEGQVHIQWIMTRSFPLLPVSCSCWLSSPNHGQDTPTC